MWKSKKLTRWWTKFHTRVNLNLSKFNYSIHLTLSLTFENRRDLADDVNKIFCAENKESIKLFFLSKLLNPNFTINVLNFMLANFFTLSQASLFFFFFRWMFYLEGILIFLQISWIFIWVNFSSLLYQYYCSCIE